MKKEAEYCSEAHTSAYVSTRLHFTEDSKLLTSGWLSLARRGVVTGSCNTAVCCPAAYRQGFGRCACVSSGNTMSFSGEWTGILVARYGVYLEMRSFSQLVKIIPALIETEYSSPCSQKTATG
jgi:hypothetical protein